MPQFTRWKSASQSWPAPTFCLGSGCCPVAWWLQLWLTLTMWSSRMRASPSARSSGWDRRGSVWLMRTAPSSSPTFCRCLLSASLTCASLWNCETVSYLATTPRARQRLSACANARPSAWWAWWWQHLVSAGCPSVSSMFCVILTLTWLISTTSCSSSCSVTCVQWAHPAVTPSCMPGCTIVFVQSSAKCSHVAVELVSRPITALQPAWSCEAPVSY